MHFGMIPEFIGRLPMVAVLDELSISDLEHILQNTKNALTKQYSKLFLMDGAQLHFTKDAIRAIAEKAIELKTGARALRSIMERIMLDVMYELPQAENAGEVIINRAVVEGRGKPKIKPAEAATSADVTQQSASDNAEGPADGPNADCFVCAAVPVHVRLTAAGLLVWYERHVCRSQGCRGRRCCN